MRLSDFLVCVRTHTQAHGKHQLVYLSFYQPMDTHTFETNNSKFSIDSLEGLKR